MPIYALGGLQEVTMAERKALNELLDDPMIQLVMASDGVEADDVRELFDRAAYRMDARSFIPAAHIIDKLCKQRGLCA